MLGETLACEELTRRGYAILARRYRSPVGEIDIVCRRDTTLVFVEVKARRSARRGTAAESVAVWKQRRIAAIAMDYLARSKLACRLIRFDVVAIDDIGADTQRLTVIEDAFRPGEWRG